MVRYGIVNYQVSSGRERRFGTFRRALMTLPMETAGGRESDFEAEGTEMGTTNDPVCRTQNVLQNG